MRLFGSRNEAYDILSRVLPQIFQSHRSPGFPQILCTRIVIPNPSVIVQNFEACGNVLLFVPNFQTEVVGFCSGNSSRLNLGSQDETLFSSRYLCQSSDNVFWFMTATSTILYNSFSLFALSSQRFPRICIFFHAPTASISGKISLHFP